ncbi:amino acid adenylation domain-containing protein [Streptomyces sp. YH02]|uniref:non-ribosomal peptide synthetase n=1 Tax=Streptomyces sp. YH02 TaxID=3256999 RepID=UPI0037574159
MVEVTGSATLAEHPVNMCVHELFEGRAALTPNATALVFGPERVSYADLNARANQLALRLIAAGAGRGELVGVYLERGPELVTGLLAVLKTGAAYTLLDPDHPVERLRSVVGATGLRTCVTNSGLAASAEWPGVEFLAVDAEPFAGVSQAACNIGPVASSEDAACVMFTSGSTGAPKGVVSPHRALVGSLVAQDYAEFGPGQVWLQSAPVSWDAFGTELLGPLLSGGTCVLQPGQSPDPDLMAALALEHGVTVLKASASLFNYLLDEHPEIFPGLQRAMTGGEPASVAHAATALRAFPHVRLTNGYGPAESMGYTIAHQIRESDLSGPSIPIGVPIAHKRAYVLDRELNLVPDGEEGDLYVAGAGLAHGYLGQPGLTAERFVADPFGAPGERMYRTGDLARRREDGALEFCGRTDEQVKIRGFRVEPAEIQNVLSGHPAVVQAAVVVREDRPGDKRLVAYAVGDADLQELQRYLSALLPEFMVPAAFVALDELPRTPNGKLDRKALPAPDFGPASSGRPAATPGEELLCELFAEVLGRDEVWADSDFFHLGGHSLLAAKLVARLRARTGVHFGLRAVFDAPTPAELAECMRAASAGEAARGIPRRPEGAPVPLSPVQSRLWFADRLSPDTAEYLVPVALRLRGALNVPALESALHMLTERHEVLRTRIVETDDGPQQMVEPAVACPIRVTDLHGGQEVDSFVVEQVSLPMDLSTGTVFRATLGLVSDADHVLVLCLHHIVADDWSLAVLAGELEHLYMAAARSRRPELPELPVQYPDVAAWQSAKGDESGQLNYWRAQLDGMPQVLELPTDRPRPEERDVCGGRIEFTVPPALVERVAELGRESGASLFMSLLSGFQVLVSRYTGERDFGIATPVAGREHPDTEGLIGFFVNTLVMRATLDDDPTFAEHLGRVRETVLAAYEHQETPFDRVVEALQPSRDLSRNPLVQIVFALQTAATASWRLDDLAVERLTAHTRTSKFDLFVALEDRADAGLAGVIEYPVALFDAATIERMAVHYVALLEQLANHSELPVLQLPFLREPEVLWLDEHVNGTHYDLGEWTVPALVARQAEERPQAVAVESGQERLTYAELDRKANRLAHYLLANGVGPETPVAVCFERGPDVPVALLGILKAGGCYVPLDAAYPQERIAFMLEDTGAPLVLAQRELADRLLVEARVWEDIQPELARMPSQAPEVGVVPEQLAYVMYTSGSTGQPKGVEITQRSIVRLVHGAEFADLTPDEVLLLLAPLSFDASTLELWGALCNGAKLAVFPPGVPTPSGLRSAVQQHGVTTMWLTAGLFHSVVETEPEALSGLKHLITGGDVVSPGHVRALVEATGMEVSDGYGPTECTTFTCVKRGINTISGPVPIGPPISNTRVYVLDEHLNRVPVGVTGELMVAGPGLARGYRGRASLTAERFVANPYEPGERMYRTGDLVRVLADGDLEFIGRADHQVKIRGFRIETGEIEARLNAHPAVERSVVLAREDIPGDKRLVAYVVGADLPGREDLRAFCRQILPDYMVPAAFVELDGFPLDPNGKVPRAALPAPCWAAMGQEYRAPRTPYESTIADIWAEVLGVERPGIDDDFFELGGHSLLAAKVIAQLGRRLRVDLGVRALFRSPTIADLAAEAAVARSAGAPAPRQAQPIPAWSGDAPLSPAQAGLWFADRLAPGSAEYLITRALRLTGPLDLSALRAALDMVVARHEPLRTRFPELDGRPVQAVDPAAVVPLPIVEVTDEQTFLRSQVDIPMDLVGGPVFRAALGRIGATEHVLLLCVHHIAADGWSLSLLAGEISEAYSVYRDGTTPELPQLPVRYGDVAAWQAGHSGDVVYWRDALTGMSQVVELPTDRPRPAVRDPRGELHAFTLPAAVVRQVADLARARRATPFMVLMASFQVLIGRYCGLQDFAVGTPVAGREHPDTNQMIGHFVNTVVLRADLAGNPDFGALIDRVRKNTLEALDHQDVSFDRIVEELQPARDLSRNPLVQLVFALQTGIEESWRLDGLESEPLPLHSRTSKFDLFLALREQSDGSLAGSVEYPVELFDEQTVRRLAGHYTALVTRLVERPDLPVEAASMLTEAERHHLVWEVNDTAVAYPQQDTLHGLIAEQAARTPDAIAVEYDDRQLTYTELDQWANGIALRLRALGVGTDVPVGVRMDRSAELMVGLLAVLKAGGCFVPIETDAPDARVLGILSDANAPVCLVNAGAPVPDSATTAFVAVDAASAANPPQVEVNPDHLISIYYTSGSTGRPKGVASTHRGWVNRMRWMQDTYQLRPDEAVLQKTTLVFDDSAVECFWPLLVGARVVLIEPGLHRDPVAIRDAAIRHRVAVLQFVPSMLTLFLECLEPGHRSGLGALRHVISSGEALPPELLKLFLERLDGAVLHNQWGATEVSIDSTARHCSAQDTASPGSVSVGSPIANNEIHVLDGYLEPVPVGVPGDLYIGGIGLARSYHRDPAKTAAAFLPSPFVPGERVYRTGDRGIRRTDGAITFLGRQDDQVKIRGIRVEPGEVEQAMLEIPGVREAAVTVWIPETGDKRLAGYVVPQAGVELTVSSLRGQLRERLPSYLVPAALTVLTEFPTTASGKTDRRALPAPDPTATEEVEFRAPEGPVAELIAEIWAEVLDVPMVGADDNFFDRGGHSLLATRAVSRMRAALDAEIPLSLIFQAATLEDTADAVEQLLLAELDGATANEMETR